ncbi:hypothetical protein ACWYXD_10805 [Enterobacter roggenkampii]
MNEYDFDYDEWKRNQPTLTEEKNHPNHWFNRASDIRASAHVLWLVMESKKIQQDLGYGGGFSLGVACHPVYIMLCGLALELIMKAVIAQKNIKVKKTHDLNLLAKDLGMPLDAKQKVLFRYYKDYIEWSGRYPVPLSGKDEDLKAFWALSNAVTMTPSTKFKGSELKFFESNGATDWINFNKLWTTVREQFTLGEHN